MSDEDAELDAIDVQLIELLQQDGRISNSRLAQKLGVTEATVRRRFTHLTETGVMRVVAVTDTEARGDEYFFWVWGHVNGRDALAVAEDVARIPEVITASVISGNYDFYASFSARDVAHMHEILTHAMGQIEGIVDIDVALALELVVSDVRWARFS